MRALLIVCALTASAWAAPAVATKTPKALKVSATEGHVCALLDDGTVRCWGDDMSGTGEHHTPVAITGVAHAVDLAVSLSGVCARHADGTATCWGDSSFLESDRDHSAAASKPHRVPVLANATELVSSGAGDGCAKYKDGTFKCWGSGAAYLAVGQPGQYGSGPLPVIPALAKATQLSVAEGLGCARMADGTATCWGRNEAGQVGDGTTTTRLAPVPVKGLRDVEQIVVARESACALVKGGHVKCWGSNDHAQLGDGTTAERHGLVDVTGVSRADWLVASDLDVCAITADKKLVCWGINHLGQLGNGQSGVEASKPVDVGLDDVRSVAMAFTHSCAVVGSGDVYCWGGGWRGVIGDGMQMNRDRPTKVAWTAPMVSPSALPKGVSVKSVAVSSIHTCAALSDGTVRCWGRNDKGMVSPGSKDEHLAKPTPVAGVTNAVAVSLSMFASFAQLADGNVVMWGDTKGPERITKSPVTSFVNGNGSSCWMRGDAASCRVFGATGEATLTKVKSVVASGLFACAIMLDGTAQCVGVNNHGQLGDGTTTERDDRFAPVTGLTKVEQLAIGDYQACARFGDGTVSCWGDVAMTGQGDAIQTAVKPIAELEDVVDISAGPSTVCARMKSGKVSCWGQIGTLDAAKNRDDWHADRPRDIPWLAGATTIALGSDYGCAVMATGALACWGENRDAQLGDGTMTVRREATPVKW